MGQLSGLWARFYFYVLTVFWSTVKNLEITPPQQQKKFYFFIKMSDSPRMLGLVSHTAIIN